MSKPPKLKRRVYLVTYSIIALLGLWALLLAIGTFQSGEADWRRPLFILGTIGSFVLIWLIAMLQFDKNSR